MFLFYTLTILVVAVSGNIYVDNGYPYEEGSLNVADRTITPPVGINPAPMHSKVFYPDDDSVTDEKFGVYYFVTGFFGVIPPLMYDDYLSRIAAHGYVVIGTWPLITDDGLALNFSAEAHFENIDYLMDNLPIRIRNIIDFDYMAVGCHSAGCAPTLRMGNLDAERIMASVNIEPVTFAIREGVHFTIPGVHMGAELANNSCSFTNWDFERYYDEWRCPRIKMEVANVSHCGILSEIGWQACNEGGACVTEDEEMLPSYHNFLQGMTSAFLNYHLQGNEEMLKYVSDPDLIPMELLQHETDLDCDYSAPSSFV